MRGRFRNQKSKMLLNSFSRKTVANARYFDFRFCKKVVRKIDQMHRKSNARIANATKTKEKTWDKM